MQVSFSGLVLSGGRGSRMGGVDKGLVLWQGLPMAEHVCRQLTPLVAQVLVSCNRNQALYS
nr:NTP transferase domain-containing protein [Pseudomonas sp.]